MKGRSPAGSPSAPRLLLRRPMPFFRPFAAARVAKSEQNRAFCSDLASWRSGSEQNRAFCSDLAGWRPGNEQNKAICSEMAGQKPENEQNRAFCSDFSGQCHRGGGFLVATRLQRWLTSIGQTKEGGGKREEVEAGESKAKAIKGKRRQAIRSVRSFSYIC